MKAYVDQQHPEIKGQYKLDFHVYGKNQFTPSGPGQLFIVAEALAPTQRLANSIASKARVGMIVSQPRQALTQLTYRSMLLIQARRPQLGTLALGLVDSWKLSWDLVLSFLCIT